MGDVLCGIPTFVKLRRKFPHDYLAWQVSSKYTDLIPKYADKIIKVSGPLGISKQAEGFDKIIKAQPSFKHKQWERSNQHLINLIAEWAGVRLETGERKIRIEIPQQIKDKISTIRPKKEFITICSSPCYSCRNWDIEYRRAIISILNRNGIHTATVGGKDGKSLGTNRSYHGELSLLETIQMISESSCYIGPDNGTSWLACAAKRTPKIMFIDPNRLKQGVVGFSSYLDDPNIKDYKYSQLMPKQVAATTRKMMKRRFK